MSYRNELEDSINAHAAMRLLRTQIRQQAEDIAYRHTSTLAATRGRLDGLVLQAQAGGGVGPLRLVEWQPGPFVWRAYLPQSLAEEARAVIDGWQG